MKTNTMALDKKYASCLGLINMRMLVSFDILLERERERERERRRLG